MSDNRPVAVVTGASRGAGAGIAVSRTDSTVPGVGCDGSGVAQTGVVKQQAARKPAANRAARAPLRVMDSTWYAAGGQNWQVPGNSMSPEDPLAEASFSAMPNAASM